MPATRATPLSLPAACSLLFLFQSALGTLQSASAQEEVAWRKDYGAALQEAQEKKRPLVLDFGTANCVYCNKLDETTFRAAAVVARLNRDFLPVKIDAAQYPTLVQHLNIQAFPTLVVATPAGKILNTQTGFLDASAFLEFLRRSTAAGQAPAQLVSRRTESAPTWMGADYDRAARAIGRSEYARAVPLLKNILKEDKKYSVQRKAAGLLVNLEKQAAARLEHVKELDQTGRTVDALQAGEELVRVYDGTAAAAEATGLLSSLNARIDGRTRAQRMQAAELLKLARKEFGAQQYLMCLLRCETITRRFANLAEATAATELAAQIKSNPEWMQQVCDGGAEVLGMSFLTLAETRLKEGQPQQAIFLLERVLQAFPNTRHAELAQVRLSQIRPPALPTSEAEKHQ